MVLQTASCLSFLEGVWRKKNLFFSVSPAIFLCAPSPCHFFPSVHGVMVSAARAVSQGFEFKGLETKYRT